MKSGKRKLTKTQQKQRCSKSWFERQHAKNRARDRADGLVYNRIKRREIMNLLFEDKKGVLVSKQSNNRHVYDLTYEGHLIRVVIDLKRHEIITFLNPSWPVKDKRHIQSMLKGEAVKPFYPLVMSLHPAIFHLQSCELKIEPTRLRIRRAKFLARQ